MTKILITGMSGTGKTTVLETLEQRHYDCVDTNEPGWCLPESGDWSTHDREWIWDEGRVAELLNRVSKQHLIVSGCRANQGTFYDRFDHVIVLRAPLQVILKRVSRRNNNAFGKNSADREAIIQDTKTIEPLLIRSADRVFDTSNASPTDIADAIEAML